MAVFTRCVLLFLVACFLSAHVVVAQTAATFRLRNVSWWGYNGDKHGPRLKFFRDNHDNDYSLIFNGGCIEIGSASSGSVDFNRYIGVVPSISESNPAFSLIVETWEKRKDNSNSCGYHDDTGAFNQPDRHHITTWTGINLNNYRQGAENTIVIVNNGYSGANIVHQVTITLSMTYIPASMVTPVGGEGNNCAHNPVTLSTGFSSALNNPDGVTYEWQFHLPSEDYWVDPEPWENCYTDCDPNSPNNCWTNCEWIDDPPYEVENWLPLRTTPSPGITFDPLSEVFSKATNSDNQQVLANTNVDIRMRAVGGSQTGRWSTIITRTFTPPPPNSSATPTRAPSCISSPTGTITLTGITSLFGTYRYILKKGDVATLGCDPESGGCLSDVQDAKQYTGGTLVITDVPDGTYSLFLLNDGGTQGVCPRRIGGAIVVSPVTELSVPTISPTSVACHDDNDGSVSLTIAGGRYATVDYALSNTTTTDYYSRSTTTANASVSFTGLKPGEHSLTVSDGGCTPAVVKTFDLTQPVKVTSTEFQKVATSCIEPGNGTARITVTKSTLPDVSVSSTYHFQIYKGDTLYNELDQTGATHTWTELPKSPNYRVIVKETGGQNCNGAIENFVIAGPVPLGIQTPALTDVTCFEGSNGALKVMGTGGTGSYVYALSGAATLSNNTGEFSNLAAGDYIITVRNTITCNDNYVHPTVTVDQPSRVVALLTKKDISCNGKTDGEVYADVSGGTPTPDGYEYKWETLLGASWTQLSTTADKLTGVIDGTYRLQVKDEEECPAISNEVTVIDPASIGISDVVVTDIRCFGETGAIAVTGSGGTGAYVFAYSLNGAAFSDFDASTPLYAGVYEVKIADVNGCSFTHPDQYTITTPAAALSFTEVLSNFNGYNISCYGGGNGSATLTPSGGNGATYSGYEYAVDNGAFQPDATLTGMYAGDHTLKVKDARGCIVPKTLTFTQTSAQLAAVLVTRKDVACHGDVTGILEYTGSGGLPPYQYSLSNATPQDQGRYTGLAIADYTITVIDKNGCDNIVANSITSINPKMDIATSITDVSCFEGSDGAITATVSSGVSPYQYTWTSSSSTAATASGLVFGTYTVTVTDNAGCKMQASAQVQQPPVGLSTALNAIPVCVGRTNGSVTAITRGGTAPYEYSIDNGQTFQADPVFIRGVGTYSVTSRDSKGCLIAAAADIIPRNDKPEPNFLVATTRSAMDTLVIIDVSIPKPDSIHWVFDSQAIVINSDQWSPELRFAQAGTYTVSMTGYFAACDYSATKTMTVNPYDPDAVKEKLPGYKPIQSVSVTPNPSSGAFEVSVKLSKKYNLSVIVFDVLGTRHYENTWGGAETITQSIVLDNVASGVYLVRVITESDAEDVRVVINK